MSIKASAITKCKECGGTDLAWQTSNEVSNGIQQGRLRTTDIKCIFVLGCNDCSETLAIVSADKVAEQMNSQLVSLAAAS